MKRRPEAPREPRLTVDQARAVLVVLLIGGFLLYSLLAVFSS